SSRLMKRASIARLSLTRDTGAARVAIGPRREGRGDGASDLVGNAEIPLDGDLLALCVAHDALAVAAELRVVARQQHEPGEHAGAELVEHRAVALVAVDLPVR